MPEEALGLWNRAGGAYHRLLDATSMRRIIKDSYRAGIRIFDSAYSYRDADNILSSSLSEIKAERASYSVIEKVMPVPTLYRKTETILKRLMTDYLDILLLHWPDVREIEGYMRELKRLKNEGICHEIGISNAPLILLEELTDALGESIVIEEPLSLLWNDNFEEKKALSKRIITYSPLGMGLLSEKNIKSPPMDERASLPSLKTLAWPRLVTKLHAISEVHGKSIEEISFSYVRWKNPDIVIRGISDSSMLRLSNAVLMDEEYEELDTLAKEIRRESRADNIFGHTFN